MAYHVDPALCIGCGLCVGLDGEVFAMTDAGTAEAAHQPETAEQRKLAQEALQSCPAAAIYED